MESYDGKPHHTSWTCVEADSPTSKTATSFCIRPLYDTNEGCTECCPEIRYEARGSAKSQNMICLDQDDVMAHDPGHSSAPEIPRLRCPIGHNRNSSLIEP